MPTPNPISTGCLPKRWPIDFLAVTNAKCPNCHGTGRGAEQRHNAFKVLHGTGAGWGFQASFYVQPFLKERRTRGKLGKRSEMQQCIRCECLYLGDVDSMRFWDDKIGNVLLVTTADPSGNGTPYPGDPYAGLVGVVPRSIEGSDHANHITALAALNGMLSTVLETSQVATDPLVRPLMVSTL